MNERESNEKVWDVIIVGGGVAGSSAAIYLKRYGMDVLVLDKGKCTLRECAFLENYTGFPAGINIKRFLGMMKKQVESAGVSWIAEHVVSLTHGEQGIFAVKTNKDQTYLAERVVAGASPEMGFLTSLPEHERCHFINEDDQFNYQHEFQTGITPVKNLYLTGFAAGCHNQAIICAGHGATLAIEIIKEIFLAKGLWPAICKYIDWVAYPGKYDKPELAQKMMAYIKSTQPEDSTMSEAELMQHIMALRDCFVSKIIDKEEATRRDEISQQSLLGFFDDDVVLAYADQLRSAQETS